MWWKVLGCMAIIVLILILAYRANANETQAKPSPTEITNQLLRQQLVKERNENERIQNRLRREIRNLRRVAHDVTYPTPAGNKRLAKAFFGNDYPAAAEIIQGETGGTWRHDVWYGFVYGAWPERTLNGQCRAYGLGQARCRSKMLKYGADAYTNPMTQLRWFKGYAVTRYGSVQAAAAYWTPGGSW